MMISATTGITQRDRIRGSLLGGAVGDALGAGIEFMKLHEIRQRFGAAGVTGYVEAYGRRGAITDDTQMTLFTAEGLLRAQVRKAERGINDTRSVVHHAYLRWLLTQGEAPRARLEVSKDGWLYSQMRAQGRRAPGLTCLAALRAATGFGDPKTADNDSKGCGGVMRAAPVGYLVGVIGDDARIFEIGSDTAALTHGHPTGYLTAGYLAVLIAALIEGDALGPAIARADMALARCDDKEETIAALDQAKELAAAGPPTPEAIELLGGGWVGEEALAIALACAMTAESFEAAVLRAVNHSGDSDSTGAILGNILGALMGEAAIPAHWLEELEARAAIARIADDMASAARGELTGAAASAAYPGH